MYISNRNSIYIKTEDLALIIEGKKEEIADQLKKKFEYDKNLIDSVLNIDPTGYKYMDYLAKQLEKYILNYQGPKGGLNDGQTRFLYDLFEDIIPWFHNTSNRITPEFLKQARDKYIIAMDRDVENFDSIIKSPKDITNYHPYFLQTLKNVIQENKSGKEKEKEAKSQVEKLYEDDDYLVLKPKTYEASCYYGAGTTWCTASKDSREHFRKYSSRGNLYYFIQKKTGEKYALFIEGSSKEIYNSADKRVNNDVLLEKFPLEITENLLGSEFFRTLMNFAKGKIGKSDVFASEEMITNIHEKDPKGSSVATISFESNEDFFTAIGVDADDAWFATVIDSPYENFDFTDSHTIQEDFLEGYGMFGDLDEENVEKLKLISTLIHGNEKFDIKNTEFLQKLSRKLLDLFPKQIDWILSDYQSELDSMMTTTARETINKQVNEHLEQYGFKLVSGFDVIKTTIGNLIWNYARYQLEKLDFFSFFKKLFEISKDSIGGWDEDRYAFHNSENFDKESFNRTVSRQFDDIIEKIEYSNEGNEVGMKSFLEMVDRINSKYKMSIWKHLPKDKNVIFRIEGFDFETNKINVRLNHQKKGLYKDLKLSEENFYNLLYQPELFEFGEV